MGARIDSHGRLYSNGGRIVFVSSGGDCPRINFTTSGTTAKLKDDYSNGFRVNKNIVKLLFA